MENLISIFDAAQKFSKSQENLHNEIESGKLGAAMYNGATLVFESHLMADLSKIQRPEYLKFAHLKGVGIGMGEAGRKYGVNSITIHRWVKRGLIAVIGHQGKQKVLIDEADMAYCAEIYHHDPGQGHWLFRPDGTPYHKQA